MMPWKHWLFGILLACGLLRFKFGNSMKRLAKSLRPLNIGNTIMVLMNHWAWWGLKNCPTMVSLPNPFASFQSPSLTHETYPTALVLYLNPVNLMAVAVEIVLKRLMCVGERWNLYEVLSWAQLTKTTT